MKLLSALIKLLILQATNIPTSDFIPPHFFTTDLPKFVVVIPSRNNEKWIKMNLDSIFMQTYKNFRVIYIDDASTDKTREYLLEYIADNPEMQNVITYIFNDTRKGPLQNRHTAIHTCADNEIIVMLDGDDFFPDEYVLEYLAEIYKNYLIWFTYGQYRRWCYQCIKKSPPIYFEKTEKCIHLPGDGWCRPLPPKEIFDQNKLREYINYIAKQGGWVFGAPRTFYAWLFKKIDIDDLKRNGKFYGRGSDVVTTIPMAEMAGYNHIKFIDKILYIYNRQASETEHDYWEERNLASYNMAHQRRYVQLENHDTHNIFLEILLHYIRNTSWVNITPL